MDTRGASWRKAAVHAAVVLAIVAVGVGLFLFPGMWLLVGWLGR